MCSFLIGEGGALERLMDSNRSVSRNGVGEETWKAKAKQSAYPST